MNTFEERVTNLVRMQLDLRDEETINLDKNFIVEYGADSLDIMEMVLALEEEFDIDIDDSVADNLITLRNVIEYVKENSLLAV